MSKKRGAKGQIQKKDWQNECQYKKTNWFVQQSQMINHEIPE